MLRFPNPGSTIDNFIAVYRSAFEELHGQCEVMKLSKRTWMALGIGIIIIAAVSLYMVYQGEAQEREEARDSLTNAEKNLQPLADIKEATEVELIQLEDELQEWQNELSQLETELVQAELTLDQTGARFPSSVESIEYDEVLFGFAHDANLLITSLTTGEPDELTTEGITYTTTFFTVELKGEVADILDFINAIVADDDFQTAILEPITIDIPEPLTEAEKENLTEEEIEEAEMPSVTINLMLYTYLGEGE